MSIKSVRQYDKNQWKIAATKLLKNPPTRHFIAGEYVDSTKGGRFSVINPATGETLAEVAEGTPEDIDIAVASAKRSFRSGIWSRMAPRARMEVLFRLGRLIDEHAEELALLDSLAVGKPIRDMISVDLPASIRTIRFITECIDKIEGSVSSTAANVMNLILREPFGVVGAIVPWNFPIMMATWKAAPALAAGNSLVLKPAEQSPLSGPRLAELFVEAGGPPGVFNVVNGIGEVAGKALALHGDVAKVSFTGSAEVGKLMLQYAGQSNMKHVALECGGKTPQIFLGDLPDLDRAVSAAYNGIFFNSGEVCNAGSRLLVDRKIHDNFVERLVNEGRDAYKPGDPLDPATNMGPLVTREAQQRVLSYIESGKREGAELLFGGGVPSGLEAGAYVEPTLFTRTENHMQIAQEEIFGPVAAVIPFDGVDEAISIANDTIYGLAAGIWTRNIDTAHRLIKEIEAGTLWINCFDEGDMTQPFGGYKQSGNARDKSIQSILSYTQIKSAWINLDSAG